MEDFILYKAFPSGGKVFLMNGLDKTSSDYNDLLSIACCFARAGREVRVLAPVHFRDPLYVRVFGSLIGTRYERKCPDLLIDGVFFEYESFIRPFSPGKISDMLTRGSLQSDSIIIDLRDSSTQPHHIKRQIINKLRDPSFERSITNVWSYNGQTLNEEWK